MPVETDAFFVFYGDGKSENFAQHANSIDTSDDSAFYQESGERFITADSLGRIPRLYADRFSRTFFLGAAYGAAGASPSKSLSNLTYFFTVQTKYRPRTAFLFGVSDVS